MRIKRDAVEALSAKQVSDRNVTLTSWSRLPIMQTTMTRGSQQGQANLTAILLAVGAIVAGVWIWKRLPTGTQEVIIDRAIPVALAGVVVLAGLVAVFRQVRRRWRRRRERDRLIRAFERAQSPAKRLELAFAMIEVNEYQPDGLEAIAPALHELFVTTLTRALGDTQHRIRGMAASHLGVLQDKESLPLLLRALDDDHAYVRSCAALGLGRMRAVEAKEKLAEVMKEDWDQTVRSRAREALERMA